MKNVLYLAVALVTVLGMAQAQATPPYGKIVSNDPRFDRLVPPGTVIEKLDDGHAWSEGPVWNRKEGYLLWSDIPKNSIFQWKPDPKPGGTASLFLTPSGYTGSAPFTGPEPGSNGLTYDPQGRLVLCEHGDRRVARLEADGKKTTLADRYEGKRLNSPNDLCYKSNGDLYFTDPPYGLPKRWDDPGKELPFQGVYRLGKDGKLTLLVKDLKAPNGIAFSPSEKILYVSVSDPDHAVWMAYDVKADGTLGAGRVFFDATPLGWVKQYTGLPDGMKIDKDGNLFAAGPGGIRVFSPDAKLLGTIEFAKATANCGWGNDGSYLYITSSSALYRIKTNTKGAGF
jgi:gluconolactonase